MGENIIRGYKNAIHEISKAYYFVDRDMLNFKYKSNNKAIIEYPYFFIAGSGISNESVKSTSEIISECKKICGEGDLNIEEYRADQYSYWVKKAFPHRETRRRYIESLVKNKKIPESVMKLANILISRKVSNLVVTPNFDPFIYESLKMFGESDILLSDNNMSINKLDIESNNLNVLHVHGTYEFYDLFNQSYLERANLSEENIFSTGYFLKSALNKMSPIVIGYGGVENDIIMKELKERLNIPLKYKIYWFCYTEEDYNNLPSWLKYFEQDRKLERDDVIFVLPEQRKDYSSDDKNLKNLIFNERLNAKDVLSGIINEFHIKSPEIIQEPMIFLKKRFINNFSKNIYSDLLLLKFNDIEDDKEIADIKNAIINNDIREIIVKTEDVVKDLNNFEKKQIKILLKYLTIAVDENTSVGFKQSDLIKIINLYNIIYQSIENEADNVDKLNFVKIRLEEFSLLKSESVRKNKIEHILNDINQIQGESDEYRSTYRKCINIKLMYTKENDEQFYDDVINKIKRWDDSEDVKLLIGIYIKKGIYLENNNQTESALTMFENAEKCFVYVRNDEWFKHILILCKVRKASLLNELEQYDNALLEIESAKNRFNNSEDIDIKNLLADAMILKGTILRKNMKFDEAEEAFDEVYDRYSCDNNEIIRRKAVKALLNKAEVLECDENYYDAVEVYNDIISRYKNDKDKELRIDSIQARLNKIVILTKSERDEIIIKKCNEVLKEYENEADERIKLIILQVRLCKAIGLHNSGRQKEAIELYNNIIKARREDADIKMKSLIMEARIFKSYCLKDESKCVDAKEMCNEIMSICKSNEDKKSKEQVVDIMLNQADSLIKSGGAQDALKIYDEIEVTYNDDVNVIRKIRELLQSTAKANFDSARLVYERLKYNCNEATGEVEDEILISEFIILVNSKEPDYDMIEQKAQEFSIRNGRIKAVIESIIGNIGTDAYINKNFESAEKYYYLLYKLNNKMCLNLAYMIRRKEVLTPDIYPNYEELIESAVQSGNDLAYINKALVLVDKENYEEAVRCIRKVNNPGAFEWWKRMDNNDKEKYMVLFMGTTVGKINESEFNINDLIEKLEEFEKNDFILQIERVIYMEKSN